MIAASGDVEAHHVVMLNVINMYIVSTYIKIVIGNVINKAVTTYLGSRFLRQCVS